MQGFQFLLLITAVETVDTCVHLSMTRNNLSIFFLFCDGFCTLRVSDQSGISQLYIIIEIYHSGQKPSVCA